MFCVGFHVGSLAFVSLSDTGIAVCLGLAQGRQPEHTWRDKRLLSTQYFSKQDVLPV